MNITKNVLFKFIVIILLTIFVGLYALKTGSLEVSFNELFRGLFIEYNSTVSIIYDLRIPRILTSILSGAALSLSGLLFQCVLKNPMADPGLIGISGGASIATTIITIVFPSIFWFAPFISILGGILSYFIIYFLSFKGSLDPIRMILTGVAIAAFFLGLENVFVSMGNRSGVSLSISGLTQLVWNDVKLLSIYSILFIAISLFLAPVCNIMSLEDTSIRGLGINVDKTRFFVSLVAVILCSTVTAIIGVVGFLALIVPHMSRKLVGNDYKVLIPYTIILGGFIFLLADTIGRLIMSPVEIPASIIMNIIGGPFFIILIRKELTFHGN